MMFSALATYAQKGEIENVKVLSIDKHPSESYLNVEVTAKYSYIPSRGFVVCYLDNAPLEKNINTAVAAHLQLYNRSAAAEKLQIKKPELTEKFRLKLKINPAKLKGGNSPTFYLGCFLQNTEEIKNIFGSDYKDYLLDAIVPIEFDINKVSVTAFKKDLPPSKTAKAEKKQQEKRNQQAYKEAENLFGGFLGLMGAAVTDSKCSYCGGSGCEHCNYSGTDKLANNLNENAYKMGYQMATTKESTIPDGYHTKVYSDGTYKGYFKNGVEHGHGTMIFKDGGKYVGDFKNGKMDGKGTLTVPSMGFKYVGSLKEGDFDGEGVLYDAEEHHYIKGVWKNGELVQIIEKGPYSEPKKSTQLSRKASGKKKRK